MDQTLGAPLGEHTSSTPHPVAAEQGPEGCRDTKAEAPKNRVPEIPVSHVRHVKSQDELNEVLESHQMWVEQVLDPDVEVASGRANLCGVDLRGLSLKEANLSGANLSKANLAEVDLTGANLSAANLQGAILACANLSGAKLRAARLDGADLRGADLTGAYLQGADLSKCIMKSPEPPAPKEEIIAAQQATADEPTQCDMGHAQDESSEMNELKLEVQHVPKVDGEPKTL